MMSNENIIPGEEDALFVIPTFNVEVRFFDLTCVKLECYVAW